MPQDALTQFVAELPLPLLSGAIQPTLLLILTVVAALGVLLLLPAADRKPTWRRLGTLLLLASAGVLVAVLVRFTAGVAGGTDGASYLYFWLFASLALAGSVRVITHPQPVYSALYFILTVFASAGLFVLLWAEFMAAALVLIYAGAVLVTYVFVIMLAAEASPTRESNTSGARSMLAEHDRVSREPVVSTIAGFAILGVMLFVIFDRAPEQIARKPYQVPSATRTLPASEQFAMAADVARPADDGLPRPLVEGNSQVLGLYLFSDQMVAIQLAGLLLTISMIGAIVIAKKRIFLPAGLAPAEPEVMHGPATPADDNPHSIPVVGTRDPRQKAYPEN